MAVNYPNLPPNQALERTANKPCERQRHSRSRST